MHHLVLYLSIHRVLSWQKKYLVAIFSHTTEMGNCYIYIIVFEKNAAACIGTIYPYRYIVCLFVQGIHLKNSLLMLSPWLNNLKKRKNVYT